MTPVSGGTWGHDPEDDMTQDEIDKNFILDKIENIKALYADIDEEYSQISEVLGFGDSYGDKASRWFDLVHNDFGDFEKLWAEFIGNKDKIKYENTPDSANGN
jgi:hypothetical protein